jgi:hypothetical protein
MMTKKLTDQFLEVPYPEKLVSAKLKTSKIDWAQASMKLMNPASKL